MSGEDMLMCMSAAGGFQRWGAFVFSLATLFLCGYCAWRWSKVEPD